MHMSVGCHYRQNSAIVTFVNGGSNFVYGAFVFLNGASNIQQSGNDSLVT